MRSAILQSPKLRRAPASLSTLARKDYKTAGHPWSVRGAFVEGMSFAKAGEIPVLAGPDFTIYSGDDILAKTLAAVWAGQETIDQAISELQTNWQAHPDARR